VSQNSTLDVVRDAKLQDERGVDPQGGAAERADDDARKQEGDAARRCHEHVAQRQGRKGDGTGPQQVVLPAVAARSASGDIGIPRVGI